MTTPCHDGDKNVFTVGLAVGHGTGEELAQVFEKVFPEMAARYSLKIAIIRSARVYQTYFSMDPVNNTFQTIQAMTNDDVKHYEAWCEKMTRMGTKVVFRTAINAQSLYLIREHQQAVKVEHFDQGTDSMLLVRDQYRKGSIQAQINTILSASPFRERRSSLETRQNVLSHTRWLVPGHFGPVRQSVPLCLFTNSICSTES